MDFEGKVHFFNHSEKDAYYIMGVTLAGYSLTWFKDTFAPDVSFDALLSDIGSIPAGAEGRCSRRISSVNARRIRMLPFAALYRNGCGT